MSRMTPTQDTTPESTPTVVTIRIPCGADDGLVADAERRLSRGRGIRDVAVEQLRGIEPQLSATVVTVEAAVRVGESVTDDELRERLEEVPGLESVVRIS
jgi:hypothetical protein